MRRAADIVRKLPILEAVCIALAWWMYAHLERLYTVQAVRVAAGRVTEALLETADAQKGYLLTADESYLDDFYFYRRLLSSRFDHLCDVMPKNAANARVCTETNALLTEQLSVDEATLQLAQHGQGKKAIDLQRASRTSRRTNDIRRRLDLIRTDEP